MITMLKRFLILFYVGLFALLWSCGACADSYFINRPDTQAFIKHMVKKYHFKKSELVALFSAVKVRPKVVERVKSPFEKQSWATYQMIFISESRIRQGVEFWNKYHDVLVRAEKIYGVPAGIIVATIGVETKYGKYKGEYPVIDALTNLAFSDSPRASFFRNELREFLLLTREQHLDPFKVLGSYAGAIGQPQFMPSSYRYYAVNFSGNKNIDLSHNEVDVIGSIANYYQKHGWQKNQPIAVPASFARGQFNLFSSRNKQIVISPAELIKYGLSNSGTLSKKQKVKLIELQGYYSNEYWLGFHNFGVIKKYNPSNVYAMAVYQLSYYIETLRERLNHG